MGSLWLSRTDKSTLRYVLVWICPMFENLVLDIYENPSRPRGGCSKQSGLKSRETVPFVVACAAVYDAGPRMYLTVHAESTSPQSRPDWRQRRPIVFPPHTAGSQVPTKFSPPGRGTWRGWEDLVVLTFICANTTYMICEIFLERKWTVSDWLWYWVLIENTAFSRDCKDPKVTASVHSWCWLKPIKADDSWQEQHLMG